MRAAAAEAQISYASVRRYEGKRNAIAPSQRDPRPEQAHPGPIPLGELRPEARRALEDFSFFQRRYLGRIATPWQAEAAYRVAELLATPEKEFAVLNAPPGGGKSTTFTHDIPAWLTCRNRALRGLMGSKVESAARRYVARLRRTLERTVPYMPEDELVAKGLAVPAEATLADDFGSFKPEQRDLWAAEGFVVAQPGNVLVAEKEPTWSAYGMDSGFLGMRYDFIVWDDLVDKLVMRTVESRENQQEWWDDVAEKRLEPSGLLLLQGQRMGPDDLYRYCLDKKVVPDDEEGAAPEGGWPAKYHHIVFKAHYEDRCEAKHKTTDPYYPEGCLLDPRRLPWRELRGEIANPRNNFAVIYQQEDADPASVLVDPLWVSGGHDPDTGQTFPGCWDNDRDLCQLPAGLAGELVSYVTVDPSPTKWWSCLAEGTLVLTRRGEVPIEEVTTEDQVMTRGGWRKVRQVAETGLRNCLTILLSNGRYLKITPDHRLLTPGGWSEAAHLVTATASHVFGVAGEHQVVGVDARRVLAEMVDLEPGRDRSAIQFENPVGEPVSQPLEVRAATPAHSVATAAVGQLVTPSSPFPAPRLGQLGTLLEVCEVERDSSPCCDTPVAACSANPKFGLDADGRPAIHTLHVVSITADWVVPVRVFDIEVDDPELHEFVAEGVIVHNCQWWVTRCEDGEAHERYLMDLDRSYNMAAPELLDWDEPTRSFVGIMEDWQARSVELGLPITVWIVEKNGAQRFLLQYAHVRRWQAKWRVDVFPHETERNKQDPDYGVKTIAGIWKYGLVRLPGAQRSRARFTSLKLVEEVTHWPQWKTDDCVMSQWFGEFRLPSLIPRRSELPALSRPSWMAGSDTYRWAKNWRTA